ncbi:unnamed protein product [Cuscuta campestris]|uniref:Uncharacterized protein n=1 Tax=Cuscuta campestris TaxID=132261 RepID=A0A484L4X4_9ASTE|nr:unnamed protein product [Cuscuta campestris]
MNTPVPTVPADPGKKEKLRDEGKDDLEKDGQMAVEEEALRESAQEELQVLPKSYAEAVGDKEELDCKLHFIAAIEHNGCKIAKMTKDDIVETSSYWETAILMCILGANPPIEVVEGFAKRIWKQADILDVTMLKPGQFVFRFDLDPKFWSISGLSKIGTLIGNPIKADKTTIGKTRLNYARIQIEVGMKQHFPEEVQFEDDKGRIITQTVKYESYPISCTHCKAIGHQENLCRKKTGERKKMVWKRKDRQNRKSLWQFLKGMYAQTSGAWCLMGDFNTILGTDDRKGGLQISLEETMDFRECINFCELEEIPKEGAYYTWTNKQMAENRIISKFCDMWITNPEFPKILKDVWNSNIEGRKMYQLTQKLKMLKQPLRKLHRRKFSNIQDQCDLAREEVARIQKELRNDPFNTTLITEERKLIADFQMKLKNAHRMQCHIMKQTWIKEGDLNSRMYHAWIKKRKLQNHIGCIYNNKGDRIENTEGIAGEMIRLFHQLLGTQNQVEEIDTEVIRGGKILTTDQQLALIEEVTPEQIKEAMFDIPNTKSPGPDGYNSGFFKT